MEYEKFYMVQCNNLVCSLNWNRNLDPAMYNYSNNNYRLQQSWAKVIFSQACVKNSVHSGGGCLPQCMLGYTPPGPGRTPPPEQTPPGSRHPLAADTPQQQTPPGSRHRPAPPPRPGTPPGSRLQHTVNGRPVRILLECILVGQCK